jgi:hypothetical protein
MMEDYNFPYIDHHSILTKDYAGIETCIHCGATGDGRPYMAVSRSYTATACYICHVNDFYSFVKVVTGVTDYDGLKKIYKKYGDNSGGFSRGRTQELETTRPLKIEIPGTTKLIKPAKTYLEDRGYDSKYIWSKYNLKSTTYESRVPYRIVIPIRLRNKDISYTARSYVKGVEPRYISCEGSKEVLPHKNSFYGIDNVKGKNVVVVEGGGPDVWRCGDGFIGSYGTEITMEQIIMLADRFENIFFLFDSGESEAQRHAREAGVILESVGKNCEILEFDEALDPDEYFLKYPEELIYMKKDLQLY